ncbi:MAG: hypothetical protein E7615_07995 [Ruminococcaceae bacterium]|nr:hypothetical protein [Oscillospiraceae bacterium]
MSTSDIKTNVNIDKKTSLRYLFVSAFCLVFGIVYEFFSNDVYSIYMLGAFTLPLILGSVVFFVFSKLQRTPSLYSRYLYHSGVAAFTVGSVIEGVLEIYGTTNRLAIYYWYGGAILFSAGIVAFTVDIIIERIKK